VRILVLHRSNDEALRLCDREIDNPSPIFCQALELRWPFVNPLPLNGFGEQMREYSQFGVVKRTV